MRKMNHFRVACDPIDVLNTTACPLVLVSAQLRIAILTEGDVHRSGSNCKTDAGKYVEHREVTVSSSAPQNLLCAVFRPKAQAFYYPNALGPRHVARSVVLATAALALFPSVLQVQTPPPGRPPQLRRRRPRLPDPLFFLRSSCRAPEQRPRHRDLATSEPRARARAGR